MPQVRNLPKIDKAKKKGKEREAGRALENQLEREEKNSKKSAGSSGKDLPTVSEEEQD